MSDLSGTTAVGIEAVEWLDGGSGNLTVRVTGRWRRRRPAASGQVSLVVEAEGRRHRFPAMPEPPSLDGAAPGTWRLSFSVPGSLAPSLQGNTWLSFGSVMAPLPAPGPSVTAATAGHRADPEGVGQPERGRLGRRPLAAAAPESGGAGPPPEFERTLREAVSERDALRARVAEGERTRRIAEQRAHAEQALRRELAHRLTEGEREVSRARAALGDLAAAEERIRELERALRDARRRGDEAEQLAATAAAARARAERRALHRSRAPGALPAAEETRLQFEARLRALRAGVGSRVPDEPPAGPVGAGSRVPDEPPAGPVGPAPRASVPPAVQVGTPSFQASPPAPGSAPAPAPGPASASASGPGPSAPGPSAPEPPAPEPPAAEPMRGAFPADRLVDTLRRELDARAARDASLRARLVAAETRLAARVLLDQRTAATLAELRAELDRLRGLLQAKQSARRAADEVAVELAAERERRLAAERRAVDLERELSGQRARSRDAYDAIEDLRSSLERLRPATAPTAPVESVEPPDAAAGAGVPGGEQVQPDRLSDALSRLRESVPPPEPNDDPPPVAAAPAGPADVALAPVASALLASGAAASALPPLPIAGGPTLHGAFRRLVRSDPDGAGRLLLELVALQRVAYPHPISYDLVLGPGNGCVRVTAGRSGFAVERSGAARTRDEVDFRVTGSPARVARLLAAHGIWRRISLRVARVRGRRHGLSALDALLALPLDLARLRDSGAALSAASLLRLAAAMIDPACTAGERFVIAHREGDQTAAATYLAVRDGRVPAVTVTAPEGRVATTVTGRPDQLLALLAGLDEPDVAVEGDRGPLDTLLGWILRAQRA